MVINGKLPASISRLLSFFHLKDEALWPTVVHSDALPFGRLWYDTPDNAIGYAMHSSRSHDAVIRVYDDAGNLIETPEHAGEFREW